VSIMLGKLYQALRAGNVPDDKAIEAASEVAEYKNDIADLKSDVRLLKWMIGFVLAGQAATFALSTRILLMLH